MKNLACQAPGFRFHSVGVQNHEHFLIRESHMFSFAYLKENWGGHLDHGLEGRELEAGRAS